jgi:hypothetical protein
MGGIGPSRLIDALFWWFLADGGHPASIEPKVIGREDPQQIFPPTRRQDDGTPAELHHTEVFAIMVSYRIEQCCVRWMVQA